MSVTPCLPNCPQQLFYLFDAKKVFHGAAGGRKKTLSPRCMLGDIEVR